MRDLTSDDLSSTLDIMYKLWEVSEEEGQELFGENFHSASYFSEAHNFNAAWRDADHIHEGLGFIPQHIKLTNMFEESMQVENDIHNTTHSTHSTPFAANTHTHTHKHKHRPWTPR